MKILFAFIIPVALYAQTFPAPGPASRGPSGGGGALAVVARGSAIADASAGTIDSSSMNCTGANLIVAVVESSVDRVAVNGVVDNVNGPYTRGTSAISNVTDYIEMWYKQNATPDAAQVVTATFVSPASFRRILTWCISGSSVSSIDGEVSANGSGVTASTAPITPTVGNGIMIAGMANNTGPITWTPNNGFTNGFSNPSDIQGIELTGGTGPITPSAGLSVSGTWRIVAASFK